MKKLKYILTICAAFLLLSVASAQIQTLGINQSQSGNPGNGCAVCYTITVQYSISNLAATGTTIVCTFPNNVFDICGYGGASTSSLGSTTTLTFNLGNQPTSANSVSYQVRFKPGTTCNGTSGVLTAKISTIEHPVPVISTPLTLTAVTTEGWAITKYIANNNYQWYLGFNSGNPFPYTVSICGSTVDVYYHVRLTNTGCLNLTGASITDNLPAGATAAGIHTGWPTTGVNLIPSTTGPGTVTWNAGNGINTLDVNTAIYDYFIHLTFPLSYLNTMKCNTATLNGTNPCTLAVKTSTSASECITLLGASPGTTCGPFGTPYYINYNWYYFIGCPAWLNISLAQTNQCAGSTTTLNNIGYNAAIPVQMHVDSFKMNAIPAGKTVTITVNTTCGPYTQTFNGALPASTINFYAPPFNIPGSCVITNFSLTSNMSISGNATQDFGQLYFTILTNTWNTNAPVLPGTTVTMTGATYSTSNGPLSCNPSFITSSKVTQIETVKDFCNYYNYYNCVNPNDTIKYSIAVQNYGTGNFTGGSIRDVLPVGLQYVPNSSTFGKYSAYTKCNVTNQLTTGISAVHAEVSNTTNLQWNLPPLNADCDRGSDWYVINFKAVVTNLAPAGLLTNHDDCYNGSNLVVAEYNYWNNNASIYVCERKVPLELTKEVSANNVTWDSCVSVPPGATVYYRLKVKNTGNVPFSQIKMMDLLPTPGDKYVVNCNSRGSTIPIYLTSALPLGNASTIEYSTNYLPTRGSYLNLIPDNTIGCNSAAVWNTYPMIPGNAVTIQNQKSIRIDFASYTLPAGQTETYFFSAQVPPGATAGSVGWNSFAATASQNSIQTLGAESRKVCVNIIDSGCGCIGNFVWFDANGNGLQDPGETGINGCTITLYDAANNPVGLPHISTNNISGQPGYYQFCGLTSGTYHLQVTPPAGYMLTIQNNTNPALNSDIIPNTGLSANFQFNCQDNNDLDIGLVLDDGCNCDQSHWGGININNSQIVIDNPHNYDGMAVNKMNRSSASVNPANAGITATDAAVIPNANFSLNLNCGKKDTVTLQCKTTYNFIANYICSKPQCGSTQIVITNPLGGTTTYTNAANFTTNDAGYYTISIIGKCGNMICDSCVFKFKVICPICPCDYKLGVKPGKNSQNVINTDPKYTLYNQAFNLSVPAGVLFTQLRAEVVSFNLTDNNNKECISCKNLPYTWGSIYNATDINTNAAVSDSITMGTNPPVTQFTPLVSNTHQNPRETIWENYSGFTVPGSLNMSFILPHPSSLTCCTLYARICVKFTFRDRNCKECEIITCFTVTIPPPSTNNGGGIPIGNTPKEMPVMNTTSVSGCATCGTANSNADTLNKEATDIVSGKSDMVLQADQSASDALNIKIMEQKIAELKKLKESGIKRGDVELLTELEKQVIATRERAKNKK
jgi:uncharacterized repeat protein (TIGR01451 family)